MFYAWRCFECCDRSFSLCRDAYMVFIYLPCQILLEKLSISPNKTNLKGISQSQLTYEMQRTEDPENAATTNQ